MNGITHLETFIHEPERLYHCLMHSVDWDERMATRKTVSYGQAYNYSQMTYPYRPFLPELQALHDPLKAVTGFEPNNCLVNYYPDGHSKMGYHSDRTDNLENGTGIAIISLGTIRTLRFRNMADPTMFMNYDLKPGSLIYKKAGSV